MLYSVCRSADEAMMMMVGDSAWCLQMEVLATSLCVLSAAVSSCAGFTLEEAAATSQETEREGKMLFSNSALNMMAINELRRDTSSQ